MFLCMIATWLFQKNVIYPKIPSFLSPDTVRRIPDKDNLRCFWLELPRTAILQSLERIILAHATTTIHKYVHIPITIGSAGRIVPNTTANIKLKINPKNATNIPTKNDFASYFFIKISFLSLHLSSAVICIPDYIIPSTPFQPF